MGTPRSENSSRSLPYQNAGRPLQFTALSVTEAREAKRGSKRLNKCLICASIFIVSDKSISVLVILAEIVTSLRSSR